MAPSSEVQPTQSACGQEKKKANQINRHIHIGIKLKKNQKQKNQQQTAKKPKPNN